MCTTNTLLVSSLSMAAGRNLPMSECTLWATVSVCVVAVDPCKFGSFGWTCLWAAGSEKLGLLAPTHVFTYIH